MTIDAGMTVLVFLPLVFVIFLAERAGTAIRKYREAAREATGRVTEALGETFGSVQSIKVAGAERSVIAHLSVLNDERRHLMVRDRVLAGGARVAVLEHRQHRDRAHPDRGGLAACRAAGRSRSATSPCSSS